MNENDEIIFILGVKIYLKLIGFKNIELSDKFNSIRKIFINVWFF